jgi:hypothetical protein
VNEIEAYETVDIHKNSDADGRPYVRVALMFEGTFVERDYPNCFAQIDTAGRIAVWEYGRSDKARAVWEKPYCAGFTLFGDHPTPPPPQRPQERPQRPVPQGDEPTGRPPRPPRQQLPGGVIVQDCASAEETTALIPTDQFLAGTAATIGGPDAMGKMVERLDKLASIPSAMEQRGTRQYLESKVATADPKEPDYFGTEPLGAVPDLTETPSGKFRLSPLPDQNEEEQPKEPTFSPSRGKASHKRKPPAKLSREPGKISKVQSIVLAATLFLASSRTHIG